MRIVRAIYARCGAYSVYVVKRSCFLLCVNYFVNYLNTHTATHAHSHWHTHFAPKRLLPYSLFDVCKYIAYRLFHYISLCAIAISDRRCESAQLIHITSVLICTLQLLSIVVDCYRFSCNFSEFSICFSLFFKVLDPLALSTTILT